MSQQRRKPGGSLWEPSASHPSLGKPGPVRVREQAQRRGAGLFCGLNRKSCAAGPQNETHTVAVHENLLPNHRPSLEGSLKGLPLPTLLQALSERRSPIVVRIIEVTHMVGAIWLQGDEVLRCEAGDLVGVPAFQCILAYAQAPRGGFRVYDLAVDPYEMHPVRLDPALRLGRLNRLMLQAAVDQDETAAGVGFSWLEQDHETLA